MVDKTFVEKTQGLLGMDPDEVARVWKMCMGGYLELDDPQVLFADANVQMSKVLAFFDLNSGRSLPNCSLISGKIESRIVIGHGWEEILNFASQRYERVEDALPYA